MRTIFYLSAFGLLTLCLTFQAFAQTRCQIVEEKPIGSANQGGYSFDYCSGKGSDCRIAKLRNHPGGLATPVRWHSGEDVLIDTTLAECPPSAKICDWIEAILTTSLTYVGGTLLSYGAGKDENTENPQGYCAARQQAAVTSGEQTPMITSISGPISDAHGKPISVGIRVSSIATGDAKKGFSIEYVIAALPSSAPFEINSSTNSVERPEIAVVWESAESSAFLQQLAKVEGQIISSERSLVFKADARDIEVAWKPLSLKQSGKTIFMTTAPAYIPKKE